MQWDNRSLQLGRIIEQKKIFFSFTTRNGR